MIVNIKIQHLQTQFNIKKATLVLLYLLLVLLKILIENLYNNSLIN